MTVNLKTDFVDGDYVYAKTTSDNDGYNAINNNANVGAGLLGEIRQFALSIAGAVTKSTLQSQGWAICDGTTATAQGISDATIETTPDLREKFLRHSADETTGGTGGDSTVTLDITQIPSHSHEVTYTTATTTGGTNPAKSNGIASSAAIATTSVGGGLSHENKPPYYDICYFIKVK